MTSVIVAVHRNVDELSGLLRCLEEQDFRHPIQVIVVDNHPCPRVASRLAADMRPNSVTVIHEPRPGLSRARNAALRHAGGDFLLFTDPDARPLARGWWHGVSIARMRQRHPDAAIYDTAQVRVVLRTFRRSQWRSTTTHLARIVGWRLEATRLARTDRSLPRREAARVVSR